MDEGFRQESVYEFGNVHIVSVFNGIQNISARSFRILAGIGTDR
jgi:hypothetical protein